MQNLMISQGQERDSMQADLTYGVLGVPRHLYDLMVEHQLLKAQEVTAQDQLLSVEEAITTENQTPSAQFLAVCSTANTQS